MKRVSISELATLTDKDRRTIKRHLQTITPEPDGRYNSDRRCRLCTRMALERMESYCAAHPDSPLALRRPSLCLRNGLWVALLGPSIEEGIVGIGSTVEAALRAFDAQ